jgi:enterochelin esterase-like enzyme
MPNPRRTPYNHHVVAIRPIRLPRAALTALAGAAFLALGLLGVYRYLDNYWLYRGFAPPTDPAWVKTKGQVQRFYLASAALGGRRQPVDVYLPPGYAQHPHRRYPVLYLLHGVPGRPGAFLATVRLGVVEDQLVALRKAQPLILVMPFGSTGSFTDKEWVDGIRPHEGWGTFVARDLVKAVDRRFRTIPRASARGIAGLSEGGYGAIDIALRHPREFRVVESWSGYQKADPVPSIFGHSRTLLAANTPLDTLAAHAATLRRDHAFVWFYSGSKDHFLAQNRAFAAQLARERIAHRFFVVRGGHNWALWRANAADAYLAAARHIAHA